MGPRRRRRRPGRAWREVAATTPPPDLPSVADSQFDFQRVARDRRRTPNRSSRSASARAGWLEAHLATLRRRRRDAPLAGDALLHFDVRSDNICIREGRARARRLEPRLRRAIRDSTWRPGCRASTPRAAPRRRTILPGEDDAAFAVAPRRLLRAHAARPDDPRSARTCGPSSSRRPGPRCRGRHARSACHPRADRPGQHLQGRCTCKPLLALAPWNGPSRSRRHGAPASRGLRMTPQRRAIVSAVMHAQGHISPTVITRKIQSEMPGVNASTVYRTLTLLEDVGVLQHSHLESGPEYHRAEEAEHIHLVCGLVRRRRSPLAPGGRIAAGADPAASRVRGRPDPFRHHGSLRGVRRRSELTRQHGPSSGGVDRPSRCPRSPEPGGSRCPCAGSIGHVGRRRADRPPLVDRPTPRRGPSDARRRRRVRIVRRRRAPRGPAGGVARSPGPTPEAFMRCHDKLESRRLQRDVVPQATPRFFALDPATRSPIRCPCRSRSS